MVFAENKGGTHCFLFCFSNIKKQQIDFAVFLYQVELAIF